MLVEGSSDNQVSNFLAFLLRVKGRIFVATPGESVERSTADRLAHRHGASSLILTFWKAKRLPPEVRRRRLSRGPYNGEMHVEFDSSVGRPMSAISPWSVVVYANGGVLLALIDKSQRPFLSPCRQLAERGVDVC